MREQDYWPDHVTFVNGILDEGSMLLGGPLSEFDWNGEPPDPTQPVGANRRYRAMIILQADGEEELRRLLDDDPWSEHHVLETAAIYRWEMLAGDIATP
jgi:uncharacterized protein YciI